jgi:hypothetical protein
MINNIKGIKMSDIQLKSEINQLVHSSGYSKSKSLLCPIVRIVSMRHADVPMKQISKVARGIL